jgi:hypothetical protein
MINTTVTTAWNKRSFSEVEELRRRAVISRFDSGIEPAVFAAEPAETTKRAAYCRRHLSFRHSTAAARMANS